MRVRGGQRKRHKWGRKLHPPLTPGRVEKENEK
jgi:hypothetical protein